MKIARKIGKNTRVNVRSRIGIHPKSLMITRGYPHNGKLADLARILLGGE